MGIFVDSLIAFDMAVAARFLVAVYGLVLFDVAAAVDSFIAFGFGIARYRGIAADITVAGCVGIAFDSGIAIDRKVLVNSSIPGYGLITGNRRVATNGLAAGRMGITVYGLVPVNGIIALGFRIARDSQVLIDCSGIRDMQFFGGRRTRYSLITFDRAGTVDSLVVRDVRIASNRRIVQIRVTGYVEVRRIRRAADGLVAFDRRRAIGCGVTLRFRIAIRRLITIDCLVAVDMLNSFFNLFHLFIAQTITSVCQYRLPIT